MCKIYLSTGKKYLYYVTSHHCLKLYNNKTYCFIYHHMLTWLKAFLI